MPKLTINFDIADFEEKEAFEMFYKAPDMHRAIWEICSLLRHKCKYEEHPPAAQAQIQKIRQEVIDILRELEFSEFP